MHANPVYSINARMKLAKTIAGPLRKYDRRRLSMTDLDFRHPGFFLPVMVKVFMARNTFLTIFQVTVLPLFALLATFLAIPWLFTVLMSLPFQWLAARIQATQHVQRQRTTEERRERRKKRLRKSKRKQR